MYWYVYEHKWKLQYFMDTVVFRHPWIISVIIPGSPYVPNKVPPSFDPYIPPDIESKKKLRQRGIEPRSTAWKATMLTITPLTPLDK